MKERKKERKKEIGVLRYALIETVDEFISRLNTYADVIGRNGPERNCLRVSRRRGRKREG